ncbi:MAG: hypothetical protein NW208_16815 [Bryobacter sp.]|nr:hypothetical protein [Bryobacter sp.]
MGNYVGIDWIGAYDYISRTQLFWLLLYGLATQTLVKRPEPLQLPALLMLRVAGLLTVFALPVGPLVVFFVSYWLFNAPDILRLEGLLPPTALVFFSSLAWLTGLDFAVRKVFANRVVSWRHQLGANAIWLTLSILHIMVRAILWPPEA